MLQFVLLVNLVLCPLVICKRRQEKDSSASAGELGGELVSSLRNDANIDLPADEEYEDLRAELLAYHSALASITPSRRSMKTTPCWQLRGICVDHRMCQGHRYLTEVPGCKDNLEVCCFTWNNFQVRDMRDKGVDTLVMPWSQNREIGGKGILDPINTEEKKHKKKLKKKHHDEDMYENAHHHQKKLHDEDMYENVHGNAHHHQKKLHDEDMYENVHGNAHHHQKKHHDEEMYENVHGNAHHHQSHHDKSNHDNPPLLVILRTKKKK